MKVFYTASYYGKDKYQKYYDMVNLALEKTGANVISPEKGNYKRLLTTRERLRLAGKEKLVHYEAVRKGIAESDAVVIEISNEDFQLGHEATLAMLNRKHVLCLSIHEDFSEKIHNRYFHGARYNEYDLDETVGQFIKRVGRDGLGVRFNGFISTAQMEYLKKRSSAQGISVSEYLRELVDADRWG